MNNFFIKIYILGLTTCLLLSVSEVVRAQDAGPRISVAPHTFDLQVLPGEIIEQKVKIFNQSDFPIPMTIRIVDFTAEDISGQMLFKEIPSDVLLTSRLWFEIEKPDFILDAGESEKIEFKIKIPQDVAPGGYYAAMIFETKFPSFYFPEESIVRNIPEIGVLFLTSVQRFTLDTGAEQKLQVAEFTFPREERLVALENAISRLLGTVALAADVNIVHDGHLNFILKIKNNDIYHIKPSGKIIISNFFGKRVGEIELSATTILPGKTRIFPAEFKPQIPTQLKWLPASITEFLVRNSFLGKYQARLELSAQSSVSSEAIQLDYPVILSFFSFPWEFWLGIFLILSAILLISTKYRTRIKAAIKILLPRQQANPK